MKVLEAEFVREFIRCATMAGSRAGMSATAEI